MMQLRGRFCRLLHIQRHPLWHAPGGAWLSLRYSLPTLKLPTAYSGIFYTYYCLNMLKLRCPLHWPRPQTPDRIEPTDATASGFYIPNPNNALKNNAASGGWSGFNYPRLEKPVGVRHSRFGGAAFTLKPCGYNGIQYIFRLLELFRPELIGAAGMLLTRRLLPNSAAKQQQRHQHASCICHRARTP